MTCIAMEGIRQGTTKHEDAKTLPDATILPSIRPFRPWLRAWSDSNSVTKQQRHPRQHTHTYERKMGQKVSSGLTRDWEKPIILLGLPAFGRTHPRLWRRYVSRRSSGPLIHRHHHTLSRPWILSRAH
mmetsp:Transcript_44422/g.110598  ORF Transcript_44422/g.110598 Transcript_44422/m.110598 type:complete len:128 (-) Transcript_44422:34-417(-)